MLFVKIEHKEYNNNQLLIYPAGFARDFKILSTQRKILSIISVLNFEQGRIVIIDL